MRRKRTLQSRGEGPEFMLAGCPSAELQLPGYGSSTRCAVPLLDRGQHRRQSDHLRRVLEKLNLLAQSQFLALAHMLFAAVAAQEHSRSKL